MGNVLKRHIDRWLWKKWDWTEWIMERSALDQVGDTVWCYAGSFCMITDEGEFQSAIASDNRRFLLHWAHWLAGFGVLLRISCEQPNRQHSLLSWRSSKVGPDQGSGDFIYSITVYINAGWFLYPKSPCLSFCFLQYMTHCFVHEKKHSGRSKLWLQVSKAYSDLEYYHTLQEMLENVSTVRPIYQKTESMT